jgi:hypothetical protein
MLLIVTLYPMRPLLSMQCSALHEHLSERNDIYMPLLKNKVIRLQVIDS